MCKAQGRIHRSIMRTDYYRFQLHEDELQSSIRTKIKFKGLTSLFRVVSFCLYHCSARVAQKIRTILTYRGPHLPPSYEGSLYIVLSRSGEPVSKCKYGSCSLPDLTGHLTARADDGHAIPLGVSGKTFNLTFILPSLLVRFPA